MTPAASTRRRPTSSWRLIGWGAIPLLLLVPLVAMTVTDEVRWGLSDFVVAALLLATAGLACEAVVRTVRRPRLRLLGLAAVAVALLAVWGVLATA